MAVKDLNSASTSSVGSGDGNNTRSTTRFRSESVTGKPQQIDICDRYTHSPQNSAGQKFTRCKTRRDLKSCQTVGDQKSNSQATSSGSLFDSLEEIRTLHIESVKDSGQPRCDSTKTHSARGKILKKARNPKFNDPARVKQQFDSSRRGQQAQTDWSKTLRSPYIGSFKTGRSQFGSSKNAKLDKVRVGKSFPEYLQRDHSLYSDSSKSGTNPQLTKTGRQVQSNLFKARSPRFDSSKANGNLQSDSFKAGRNPKRNSSWTGGNPQFDNTRTGRNSQSDRPKISRKPPLDTAKPDRNSEFDRPRTGRMPQLNVAKQDRNPQINRPKANRKAQHHVSKSKTAPQTDKCKAVRNPQTEVTKTGRNPQPGRSKPDTNSQPAKPKTRRNLQPERSKTYNSPQFGRGPISGDGPQKSGLPNTKRSCHMPVKPATQKRTKKELCRNEPVRWRW